MIRLGQMEESGIPNRKSRIVVGTVTVQLPSGLYQVEVDGARRVTAHLGSGTERNFIRVLVGDRVEVQLTARDLSRGRIVRRV